MITLHQNVANCQNTLTMTMFTLRWRILLQDAWMSQTNAGMTQDNFILPALPVGGLAWQNEACSQSHHSNHLIRWKEYGSRSFDPPPPPPRTFAPRTFAPWTFAPLLIQNLVICPPAQYFSNCFKNMYACINYLIICLYYWFHKTKLTNLIILYKSV